MIRPTLHLRPVCDTVHVQVFVKQCHHTSEKMQPSDNAIKVDDKAHLASLISSLIPNSCHWPYKTCGVLLMAQLFSLHLQLSAAQSSSTYRSSFEALQDGAASRCVMAQLFSLGLQSLWAHWLLWPPCSPRHVSAAKWMKLSQDSRTMIDVLSCALLQAFSSRSTQRL